MKNACFGTQRLKSLVYAAELAINTMQPTQPFLVTRWTIDIFAELIKSVILNKICLTNATESQNKTIAHFK